MAPWFPDPVMLKELRAGSRSWTLYAGRVFYVGLVGLILYSFWASFAQYRTRESLSEYATIGRQLFSIFAVFQVIFATLQGISGGSDQITRETRGGTLGLLGLTPLSCFRIAFGKFQAALAQPLMVVLAGTPVLAICIFLGGVPPSALAWCTGLSLACGALGAGTALLCSAFFKTGAAAAISSVVILSLYSIAPAFLMSLARGGSEMILLGVIACLHPAWALGMVMMSGFAPTQLPVETWMIAVPVSFAQALLLVWLAGRRLRVLLESRSTLTKLETLLFPGMPPSASSPGHPPVWERWPLLWKELRSGSGSRLGRRFRIALAIFLCVLAPLSLIFSSGERYWVAVLVWLGGLLLLLLAVGAGAALFVKEKEERKWDILLTTPLSTSQILLSKLLGGLADLLPLAGILLLVTTAVSLAMGAEFWAWAVILLTVALPILLIYTLSALISLRAPTLRRAFSNAFGGMLFLYFLLPFLLMLLYFVIIRSGNSDAIFYLISPAPYLAEFSGWVGYPGDRPLGSRLLQRIDQLLFFAGLHLTLILTCMALMWAGFKKAAGRT